ncbi:MAG: hypothetical protein IJY55_04450 [Clostridia bacterium]|nr:hypothetical protein [Clostridia bacterium]
MKKRTKILIITAIALVILVVAGFFIGKYYVVNYAFDRIFEKGIAGIANSAETVSGTETTSPEETSPPEENEDELKPPEEMSEKEVIKEVMKDSALISKMSTMVSYSDRERVIAIILSNFSAQEISHYSAMVAKGIDSATKSELMSIARSRLTSAQLSECMQIAYKYADEIRPYLRKN